METAPFTPSAEPGAEARLASSLQSVSASIASALGPALQAVVVVGGYARGEGGLVDRDGALMPYNDCDLVAVVRRRSASERRRLDAVGRQWSERLGVDVDIWPVTGRALERVPPTLFWLDVALGGARTVFGSPEALRRARRVAPRDVPLDEAGRLLANRATGLALSNLEARDRDGRRARHVHKAVLACGDARLLAAGRYAPSVAGRLAELRRLRPAPAIGEALVEAYADAACFRLRPDLWSPPGGRDHAARWYDAMRSQVARWHLGFEHWRVGAPTDLGDLGSWRGRLFPAPPDVRRGGGLAAALRAAAAGDAPWRPYLGHPRERLARVSILLAYGIDDPALVRSAARLLGAAEGAGPEELHRRLGRLVTRGG